jgi:prepilin-type N-terminal cleavage/methylation domain-containing protein
MRGFTVLELMVSLVILGVLTGLSALAFRARESTVIEVSLRTLGAARTEAIRTGRPVEWEQDTVAMRFLPDGSSSGGRITLQGHVFAIDPLTGGIHEAR